MADVGELHRHRASLGTAAQAECGGDHDGEPEDRRPDGEQLPGVDLVAHDAVDRVGDRDHHDQSDECEQVGAVGHVVPLDVTEPSTGTCAAQFAQRGPLVGGHRRRRYCVVAPAGDGRASAERAQEKGAGFQDQGPMVGRCRTGSPRRRHTGPGEHGDRTAVLLVAHRRGGPRSHRARRAGGPRPVGQRIAMYPLAPILLVGALRRDPGVRWYVAPIAVIGAIIAGYHTLIEWRPELDTGTCELTGPSCTVFWFREFGFITLATMALVGFLTILTLLFVRVPSRLDGDTVDDAPADSNDYPPNTTSEATGSGVDELEART